MTDQKIFINACMQGNVKEVQRYLFSNKIDINQIDDSGRTPLHAAMDTKM